MNLGMLGPARQLLLKLSHVYTVRWWLRRGLFQSFFIHISGYVDNQLEAGTFLAPWLSLYRYMVSTWVRVANFLQGGYRFSEQVYPEKLAEASGYLEILKSLEKSHSVILPCLIHWGSHKDSPRSKGGDIDSASCWMMSNNVRIRFKTTTVAAMSLDYISTVGRYW